VAEGKAPDAERISRVRDKLQDDDALLVVARRDDEVVGMALAEPFRDHDGEGDVRPGVGHVSMVFVHPDAQGRGVGRELMGLLAAEARWSQLSVWTRDNNEVARRLYAWSGFELTADRGSTANGDPISRWETRPRAHS
jgi:ribosomal protein S18 acetylase RimI-like enzyme